MSGTIVGTGTITSSGSYVLDPNFIGVLGTADATVEGVGTNANVDLSALAGTLATAITTYTVDVLSGATATVTPPSSVIGLLTTIDLIADGGTVVLGGGGPLINLLNGPINGTIENGGTLDLTGVPRAADGTTIATFKANGGLLDIGSATTTGNATINGFGTAANQIIDDKKVSFANVTGYTVTQGAGSETITFAGTNAKVTVQGTPFKAGTYTQLGGPLVLSAAADGSLLFAACFLTGTLIQAERDAVPVEQLRTGDLVRTAAGELVPVHWVGHRTVRLAAAPDAALVAPICIGPEAIAPGLPRRDLWVTPDHGIVVDGHLIPARLLVNGASIRQVQVPEYTYYHVELDRHAILLAEGLDAESYLDTGNRSAFANSGVVSLDARLPESQAQAYAERGCMGLTVDPAVTAPVWTRLADRAAMLGLRVAAPDSTQDPRLRLRTTGGRSIQPLHTDAHSAVFAIPADATEVSILSRATMPWALTPWVDDRRRLGVAIGRIVVRTAERVQEIAIDSPALRDGWWAAEHAGSQTFRWTAGAARLSLPRVAGPATLEMTFVERASHPVETAREPGQLMPMALAG